MCGGGALFGSRNMVLQWLLCISVLAVVSSQSSLCGNGTVSSDGQMVSLEGPAVIYADQTVHFNCTIAPVGGVYRYRWRRGSEILPGEENASLVRVVPLSWAGSCLTCEVDDGRVNVSQILQVLSAVPSVSVSPSPNLTVDDGASFSLRCIAYGLPPVMMRWLYEGVSLGMSGDILEVPLATEDDAGQYTCEAWNSEGTGEAHTTVIVRYAPVITNGPEDVDAVNGSTLLLNCSARAEPPPSITWFRGGVSIISEPGGRVEVLSNGSLYVRSVVVLDTGTYICNASNSRGTAATDSVMVMVLIFPTFDLTPVDVVVRYMDSATLRCVAMGLPEVHYEWRREVEGVIETVILDDRVTVDEGNLTIASVRREDEGVYFCNVSNELGSIQETADIRVLAPPLPPSQPLVESSGASWFVVEWQPAASFPPPDYIVEYRLTFDPSWSNLTTPVSAANVTVLYPNATYLVRVSAVSPYGQSSASPEVTGVTLHGVPLPDLEDSVDNISVETISSTSVLISWTVPHVLQQTSFTGSLVTAHRLSGGSGMLQEMMQLLGNTFTYNLTGLVPATLYLVGVALQFSGGGRGPEVTVNVTTQDAAPGDAPSLVSAILVPTDDPTLVHVSWATPTQPHGTITAYTVYYSPPESVVVLGGVTTEFELRPILPYTNYTFMLSANTSAGEGPMTTPFYILTPQAAPPPPVNVMVTTLNSSALLVTWQPYEEGHVPGVLMGYMVRYQLQENITNTFIPLTPHSLSVVITELLPYATYVVAVAASTAAGYGNFSMAMFARTAPDVSSWVADDLQILEQCPSSNLLLSWRSPEPYFLGGPSDQVEYIVSYTPVSEGSEVNLTEPYTTATYTVVMLEGVRPYTSYQVRVALRNSNGTAAFSPWASNTTCDAAAPPPSNMSVLAVNSSAVSVTWRPPSAVLGTLLGYTICLRPAGSNSSCREVDTTGSTYLLNNLEAYTLYIVGMASRTRGPLGVFYEANVRTDGTAPAAAVTEVHVLPTCPASLNVSWTPLTPANLRGPSHTSYYSISYSSSGGSSGYLTVPYLQNSWVLLSNLTVGSEYSVVILVNGSYGVGPASDLVSGTAPEGVPSAPVTVEVESVGVASIDLRWQQSVHPRGHVKYCVEYRSLTTPTMSVCSNDSSVTLSDLQPFTSYSMSVVAMTACGTSEAVSVTNRTLPTLPGPPDLVAVVTRLPYSVHLQWAPPSQPNGLIGHYNVYCGGMKKEVFTAGVDCGGLTPETNYTVGVAAVNMEGEGPNVTVYTATTCEPAGLDYSGTTVTLGQGQCSYKFTILYVLVLVQELVTYSNGSYDPPSKTLTSFSLMKLQELTKEHTQTRSRRQINKGGVVYIAANITEEELDKGFVVGDSMRYGEYFNSPLTPGIKYQVGYRATVPGTDTPLYLTLATPIDLKAGSTPPSDSTPSEAPAFPLIPVAAAGGAGGLLILLICMAACFSCLCCCCSRSLDKEEVVPLQRHASFRLSEKKRPADPIQSFRNNKRTEALEDHAPVPVEGFVNRLMVMRTNDNQLFLEEFGSIPMTMPTMSKDVANLPVNKPKNRYYNIVPYDATRVKVKGQGSDYINASYCSGYRRNKAYIATQGPMPATLAEFWRMVWDEGIQTLVMLTNTQEKGKVKCEAYWPRSDVGSTVVYGSLEVTLTAITVLADYTIRTLQIHKVGSNKEGKEVVQFHFTSWPDHGVPQYATAMLSMMRRVRAHYNDVCGCEGPMLVHCSAGVGRTGTFIVIDTMLQRLAQGEEYIDIYGHVSLLRAQRSDMVQTEDQYFFIHEAVAEALLCGNTEVPMDHLPGYVADLCSPIPDDEADRTRLELEFKRLALERNSPHRWTSATKDANKTKNRFVNVLPYDSSRVVLNYCPGVDGSDYINANHVDSYRSRRAFIAGQGPLPSTVLDFWRMIWEHSVTVIVMLTELKERGHECSACYWPEEALCPVMYGQYQVDLNVQRKSNTYTYRDFSVTNTSSGEKRLVLQFQFHSWPEVGIPQPLVLVEFLREVQKLCRSLSTQGPVLVHCSNGVGRSGVFIALHIILERLLEEGLVDVFQTVKNLRIQRPAMVQTLEQYHFCYDAVVNFIQTSDTVALSLTRRRHSSSSLQRQGSRRGSRRTSRSRSTESHRKSKNTSPSPSPAHTTGSLTRATPLRSESVREVGPAGIVRGPTPVDLAITEVSQMYGGSEATSTFGTGTSPPLSQERPPSQANAREGLHTPQGDRNTPHTGTPRGSIHTPQDGIHTPASSIYTPSLDPHTPDLASRAHISNANMPAAATPPMTVPGAHGNPHGIQNGPYAPDVSPYPGGVHNPLSISYAHNGSHAHFNGSHSPANSSHLILSSSAPRSVDHVPGLNGGHYNAHTTVHTHQDKYQQHQLQDIHRPADAPSHTHNSQGESTQL